MQETFGEPGSATGAVGFPTDDSDRLGNSRMLAGLVQARRLDSTKVVFWVLGSPIMDALDFKLTENRWEVELGFGLTCWFELETVPLVDSLRS